MPVIFENSDFWIISERILVTVQDAAGIYTSSPTVTLVKPGAYVGCSVTLVDAATNDNTEALGGAQLNVANGGGFGTAAYGDQVTTLRMSIQKTVGTAGATALIYEAMIFLKK